MSPRPQKDPCRKHIRPSPSSQRSITPVSLSSSPSDSSSVCSRVASESVSIPTHPPVLSSHPSIELPQDIWTLTSPPTFISHISEDRRCLDEVHQMRFVCYELKIRLSLLCQALPFCVTSFSSSSPISCVSTVKHKRMKLIFASFFLSLCVTATHLLAATAAYCAVDVCRWINDRINCWPTIK